MDPLSCPSSPSTTAGFIVHPNAQSHIGTINLKIYEAPKPPMPLPKTIESDVQDPNKSFVGRAEVLELVHKAIGDSRPTGLQTSEPKYIGCLTPRTWALVVASISIISSGIIGIINIIALIFLPQAEQKEELTREQVEISRITLPIIIFVQAVDIFMAFLLIFGVHRRSGGAVRAWICYAYVALLVYAIASFADDTTTPQIIRGVIELCVMAILIYTVQCHWKEIIGSSGQNVVTDKQDGV